MNKIGKILEKVIRASKKSREWRSFVYFLAAVVVFTTTYALILPAITVETPSKQVKEYYKIFGCSVPAHVKEEVFRRELGLKM